MANLEYSIVMLISFAKPTPAYDGLDAKITDIHTIMIQFNFFCRTQCYNNIMTFIYLMFFGALVVTEVC